LNFLKMLVTFSVAGKMGSKTACLQTLKKNYPKRVTKCD
jgi:hypothetical protein